MDRLVRSRAWVVIVGVGLIGIVAMQVSMLKLNSGISRAVDTVATLERSNASLKAEVSRLSSGDRIQSLAGQHGFLMPEPADVTYLRAGDKRSDGFRAARRMRAPRPDDRRTGRRRHRRAGGADGGARRDDGPGVAGSRRPTTAHDRAGHDDRPHGDDPAAADAATVPPTAPSATADGSRHDTPAATTAPPPPPPPAPT